MVRLFVRHQVEDFDRWKTAYNAFDEERRTWGVEGDGVFRDVENSRDVTVWHDFADEGAARTFAESDRLRKVMEDAGVDGAPEVWFTTRA